jgi:hypothetical protein
MYRAETPVLNPVSTAGNSAAWLGVVLAAAGFGALWGAVFGFAAHAVTRGQRDFSSIRGLSAAHYDLIARDGTMERARHMLTAAGLLPAAAGSAAPHPG